MRQKWIVNDEKTSGNCCFRIQSKFLSNQAESTMSCIPDNDAKPQPSRGPVLSPHSSRRCQCTSQQRLTRTCFHLRLKPRFLFPPTSFPTLAHAGKEFLVPKPLARMRSPGLSTPCVQDPFAPVFLCSLLASLSCESPQLFVRSSLGLERSLPF